MWAHSVDCSKCTAGDPAVDLAATTATCFNSALWNAKFPEVKYGRWKYYDAWLETLRMPWLFSNEFVEGKCHATSTSDSTHPGLFFSGPSPLAVVIFVFYTPPPPPGSFNSRYQCLTKQRDRRQFDRATSVRTLMIQK